jgi:uncharacterized protein (TIGR01244 family)
MNRRMLATLFLFSTFALGACSRASEHTAITTEKLEPYTCGTIQRLNTYAGIFLASQPAAEDFRQAQKGGVKTVVNLRPESEIKDFDEPKLIAELGLAYVNIPFAAPDELSDAVFARARETLDKAERPILLHCHSGNRVGAIWLAWRALDGGLDYEAALAEARTVGLKAPALEAKARDYIERQRPAAH